MSRFHECIDHILDLEGGFVNDPDDKGGATKWGITLGFYRDHVDASATVGDIKSLSRTEAEEIYREHFWRPASYAVEDHHYGELPRGVDSFVLSLSINMGWRQAHKLLQKAIVASGEDVSVDGWLGPTTLSAARRTDPEELVSRLGVAAALFYVTLAERNPSQKKFLEGWLYRAFSETVRSTHSL